MSSRELQKYLSSIQSPEIHAVECMQKYKSLGDVHLLTLHSLASTYFFFTTNNFDEVKQQ